MLFNWQLETLAWPTTASSDIVLNKDSVTE